MKTRGGLLRHALDPDVEPDRGVESRLLLHDEVLELVAEGRRLSRIDKIPVLQAPCRDGVDDTVDNLPQRGFPSRHADSASEVLLSEDVGRVQAPGRRHLHAQLFERDRSRAVVADARIAALPDHLVVRVTGLRRELALNADPEALSCNGH